MKSASRFSAVAIIALLGFATTAYWNSFYAPFLMDDFFIVINNAAAKNLNALFDPHLGVNKWRPLANLSFIFNHQMAGPNVLVYHITNTAIHAINGVLLYFIITSTLQLDRFRQHYQRHEIRWIALAIAIIWLVHPLNTQSVTYIVQRCESLMGTFYLAAFWCAIQSFTHPHQKGWMYSCVTMCALGMGVKEVMVTAPLLILLYDYTFIAGSLKQIWQKRALFYSALFSTIFILIGLMFLYPATTQSAGFTNSMSSWSYFMTQPGVLLQYLKLAGWPTNLSFDYGWPLATQLKDTLPSILIMGALLSATMLLLIKKYSVGFLGACFFIILLPTSSLLPIKDPIAEHRMYLPLIPLVGLFVSGIFLLLKRLHVFITVSMVLIVLLTLATTKRNEVYKSELSLWQDAVQHAPDNAKALMQLGGAFMNVGELQRAEESLKESIRIQPNLGRAQYLLGMVKMTQQKYEEALEWFDQAHQLDPNNPDPYLGFGQIYKGKGQLDKALEAYQKALLLNPQLASSLQIEIGSIYAQKNNFELAGQAFKKAVEADPLSPMAHYSLGYFASRTGKQEEGAKSLFAAIRYDPNFAEAYGELGRILLQNGQFYEAKKYYLKAAGLNPLWHEAQERLKQIEDQLKLAST